MTPRKFWQGLLFTAFLFTGLTAHAGLILTLDAGGGDTATVDDTDGDGFVGFVDSLGDWFVNVTTGLTNPAIGTDYVDQLLLNSVNVSGGTGELTITLTRTDLERSPANWVTQLGGVTFGTVDFATLLNGSPISGYSASAGAFSYTDSGGINTLTPYSLSLVATINHDNIFQSTAFSYNAAVPEPSTLALLGSGLLLVGWAGTKRRRPIALEGLKV